MAVQFFSPFTKTRSATRLCPQIQLLDTVTCKLSHTYELDKQRFSASQVSHTHPLGFFDDASLRSPVQTGSTGDLDSFLNSSRVEPEGHGNGGGHY